MFRRRIADPWSWPYKIKHIKDAHHQNKSRERSQPPGLAFKILMQKHQEWKAEMQEYQDHADPTPNARQTDHKPLGLLRNIPGPDDQKLCEIEVCPHHDKRQHQLAKVVEMSFV